MANEQLKKDSTQPAKGLFKKFPPQFWLVILFEFIERGSYYGMMSFISDYFVGVLNFPKESVGVIKGIIQPLLYFLPIISGALADRFGYRRMLMIAFSLLGTGYILTSQTTSYTGVFMAMVVMGLGAGTFKPIVSGTIARVTDESNSTQGFGIFYWSINLGAFLFPLFLVPYLKNINPTYVIIAAGLCTGAMLIPTAFFYKDPIKKEKKDQTGLIQTLANAFEIIYSPLVILYFKLKKSSWIRGFTVIILILLTFVSFKQYFTPPVVQVTYSRIAYPVNDKNLIFNVKRNMAALKDYDILKPKKMSDPIEISIFKPDHIDVFLAPLTNTINQTMGPDSLSAETVKECIKISEKRLYINIIRRQGQSQIIEIKQGKGEKNQYFISLSSLKKPQLKEELLKEIHRIPQLRGISSHDINNLIEKLNQRPFFLLFIVIIILLALLVIAISHKKTEAKEPQSPASKKVPFSLVFILLAIGIIWIIPGLSMLAKIICSVICFSASSLFMIDKSEPLKFTDHSKFLLMIVLYSGFWILYFQMFDSVLWYVKAYVDAQSLNNAINGIFAALGVKINWFFDVEHVTVINAGTIIILQLLISSIVKNKKALPTMITGIAIATCGMAILAISTNIWIFMAGIMIFSIGEMTAHPKFISYIGLIAPKEKKALYQGYLFLYGVFGSSVGAIIGAQLYVHFVDNLNQPRILWLMFSGIGLLTIFSLFLYNRFIVKNK